MINLIRLQQDYNIARENKKMGTLFPRKMSLKNVPIFYIAKLKPQTVQNDCRAKATCELRVFSTDKNFIICGQKLYRLV